MAADTPFTGRKALLLGASLAAMLVGILLSIVAPSNTVLFASLGLVLAAILTLSFGF